MLAIQKILSFAGLSGKIVANGSSAPTALKTNLAAATNPGPGDDTGDGYAVGSEWFNTTLGKSFICVNATLAAAVWREVGGHVSETIVSANSFAALDVLKRTGGTWAKAQADGVANADVVGLVEEATGSEFSIIYSGKIRKASHGFTVGAVLYLSPSSPGSLTATEPVDTNHVSKPIAIAIDADNLVIINQRGTVVTATKLSAASQSEVEAASSNTVGVTPGTIKYYKGVAKAWVRFKGTSTVTVLDSLNVSSVTDVATGRYIVNFTGAFENSNYGITSHCAYPGLLTSQISYILTTTQHEFETLASTFNTQDNDIVSLAYFGEFA
jgi:hypothetical protein